MKTAYVRIFGYIGFDAEVSAEKVRKDLEAQKPFDSIQVLINSGGGDPYEAFAVNAVLRSYKKPVKTLGMSLCASAATLILAEGDRGERECLSLMDLIFHNPWTTTQGDAQAHEERAEYLRKIESMMADFYVDKYGIDRDTIVALMKQDKPITPQEAQNLGLVDRITEGYAVAASVNPHSLERMQSTINQINQSEMNHKNEKAEGILDKIKSLTKGWSTKAEVTETIDTEPENKVRAMVEDTLSDGTPILIEAIATVNGEAAPDGDHTLSSGITITTSGGEITGISVAQATADTEASAEDRIEDLANRIEKVEAMAKSYKVRAEKAEGDLHKIHNTVFGVNAEVEKEQHEPVSAKAPEHTSPFAKQEAELRQRLLAKKNRVY